MTRVLITGGAGFIGSHTSDVLLDAGYQVTLLDNLTPQVHGPMRQPPSYLNPEADLIIGDVTDPAAVDRALRGVDLVLHLASTVGVWSLKNPNCVFGNVQWFPREMRQANDGTLNVSVFVGHREHRYEYDANGIRLIPKR